MRLLLRTLTRTLTMLVILLLSVDHAHAQLSFTLNPTTTTLTPGNSFSFLTTLVNAGPQELFLNADRFGFGADGITLDDTHFFTDVPLSLQSGETWSGPIFDVSAGTNTASGIYSGAFTILGGDDSGSADDLATQTFSVVVPSAAGAPEPGSIQLILILSGILVAATGARSGLTLRARRKLV